MAQYGFGNNGIRVRDPSQMFVFGNTNWVRGFSKQVTDSQESAGLLTKDKSQQVGIFSKPFIVNQSNTSDNKNLPDKDDKREASISDENQPYSGSNLTNQSQRPTVNYFDPFQITQQMGCFKKPSRSPKCVNNQLPKLVSVKKEDGQQWSTGTANTWLGSHVQQNEQIISVTGSCELPSTPYASNKRIRKRSNTRSLNSNKRNTRITKRSDTSSLTSKKRNTRITKRSDTRSLNSKKRKLSTFGHLPWHKEVSEGSSKLHNIRTAEVEWARSVARVPGKLKELGEKITNLCSISKQKRRLNLTTHLMQMLFQPPPANVLAEDAITHCDVVTYYGCKLTLGGACGLCASAGKSMASKTRSDQDLLKVIEGFMERSKRLEDDFLRLEKKRSLILEVIMGFKDLERYSTINRFAKYHNRNATLRGDTSSSAMPKLCAQGDVFAIPNSTTVPEAQNCFSL